jgi:hypothetical protein
MSTLLVVEEVLREHGTPMVVREIVEAAAERLPTRSKTPDTVVARDLAMDIKKRGPESRFARVAPGRYTLRELALAFQAAPPPEAAEASPSPLPPLPLPQNETDVGTGATLSTQ